MKPLIDCDVLRYEIGACGQYVDEDGDTVIRSFDFVAELFDQKVKEICELTWADEEPLLFLTADKKTKKILNRHLRKEYERLKKDTDVPSLEKTEQLRDIKEKIEFKPNFREEIAKKKPYKGTRKPEKPYHYENLTSYILAVYECAIAEGIEADDLISIYHTNPEKYAKTKETIICTRDKDLRSVPGPHFGWACGKQDGYGPVLIDELGSLEPVYIKDTNRIKKIVGTGLSFFCLQLLTGDTVDNIPGLPGTGPSKAYSILKDKVSYKEMLKAVVDAYIAFYGDSWEEELMEQAYLLWMVREYNEKGEPIMFELPGFIFDDSID
jgi:hypothetical protein